MPQARQELREEFQNDGNAIDAIKESGGSVHKGGIMYLGSDARILRAVEYLIHEWDYGLQDEVKVGQVWQHRNGIKYEVIHIANELNAGQYPMTVVYKGPNGKVWTRPLNDWHRSMTLLP